MGILAKSLFLVGRLRDEYHMFSDYAGAVGLVGSDYAFPSGCGTGRSR